MNARLRIYRGQVVSFDEERGLGEVKDDSGEQFGFHCTAIADGSRKIEVEANVSYLVTPGHMGKMEATCLVREH